MVTKTEARRPFVSGFCNPTLPRTATYDPHQNCRGCTCTAEGCPCRERNAAATTATVTATVISPVTEDTAARWLWEADAAAELMLEDGDCPICRSTWDSHNFEDDGRVSCP